MTQIKKDFHPTTVANPALGPSLVKYKKPVTDVALNKSETHLATQAQDGTYARVWDLKRPEKVAIKVGASSLANSTPSFHPVHNGKLLVTNLRGVEEYDFTAKPNKPVTSMKTDCSTQSCSYSAEGNQVIMSGTDGLRLWDVRSNRITHRVAPPAGKEARTGMYGGKFSENGQQIYARGLFGDGANFIWDMARLDNPSFKAAGSGEGMDFRQLVALNSAGNHFVVPGSLASDTSCTTGFMVYNPTVRSAYGTEPDDHLRLFGGLLRAAHTASDRILTAPGECSMVNVWRLDSSRVHSYDLPNKVTAATFNRAGTEAILALEGNTVHRLRLNS